ncbi:MAG: type II toxin-antitoxin system HipA family toxin [Akkermansia sp.]|nr:type II toxin-antitoxin system HipA family toxin [Akkermansia sp.]
MKELPVYHGDREVGSFGMTEQAEYYIAYSEDWKKDGFPLSVHLPLDSGMHMGKAVEYFIENLLPEAAIRLAISQRFGISANNYFSLMKQIGRDCAGAFSLGAPQSSGEYKALEENELIDILSHLPQYPLASNRPGVSFSLAGAQNKIPLFRKKGIFHLPLHGAASNCIIKTPMERVKSSVVNELFCMKLATRVLRHVAATEFLPLPGISSLVVQRYDRRESGSSLQRIPQEDFCQLASLPSAMKYECDGGPGFRTCAELLRTYSTLPAPDIMLLVRWAAFNLCIGNMDAHAKNLSLCTIKGGLRLAPFYDLISTLQYPQFNGDLAMNIGGIRNPARIGKAQWEHFADEIQLPRAFVLKEIQTVMRQVIEQLPNAAEELRLSVPDMLFIADLKQNILQRCLNALRLLR